MANTKSQQTSSFSQSGRILGIRWYWWIVIFLIVFFLTMGSTAIGKGASGALGAISRAFLGFADGLLNILAKSPLLWVFGLILVFPFLGRGAAMMFTLYKSHFGSEKKTQDVVNELGLDKDTLQEKINEKRKEGKPEKDVIKEVLREYGTNVSTKYVELEDKRIDAKVREGKITTDQAITEKREARDQMNKAVDEFNKQHETDVKPVEPVRA